MIRVVYYRWRAWWTQSFLFHSKPVSVFSLYGSLFTLPFIQVIPCLGEVYVKTTGVRLVFCTRFLTVYLQSVPCSTLLHKRYRKSVEYCKKCTFEANNKKIYVKPNIKYTRYINSSVDAFFQFKPYMCKILLAHSNTTYSTTVLKDFCQELLRSIFWQTSNKNGSATWGAFSCCWWRHI